MRRLLWTFVHDDSFIWAALGPRAAHRFHLYRRKMTPEEQPDDELFINSNFLAKGPIKSKSQDQYDPSGFFRIGSITGRCPQNTAQTKPQPDSSSEPKDSVKKHAGSEADGKSEDQNRRIDTN